MNDSFYEQLVAKKSGTNDKILRILLIVLVVMVIVSALYLGPLMIPVGIVLAVILRFLVFPKFHVEYEYSLLNWEMNIDVIYNQLKRKHLLVLDLKEAEVIAPKNSHYLDSYQAGYKTLDYSAGNPEEQPYAIMMVIDRVMTCILIQPDAKMLDHMASFLPRTLHRD